MTGPLTDFTTATALIGVLRHGTNCGELDGVNLVILLE